MIPRGGRRDSNNNQLQQRLGGFDGERWNDAVLWSSTCGWRVVPGVDSAGQSWAGSSPVRRQRAPSVPSSHMRGKVVASYHIQAMLLPTFNRPAPSMNQYMLTYPASLGDEPLVFPPMPLFGTPRSHAYELPLLLLKARSVFGSYATTTRLPSNVVKSVAIGAWPCSFWVGGKIAFLAIVGEI